MAAHDARLNLTLQLIHWKPLHSHIPMPEDMNDRQNEEGEPSETGEGLQLLHDDLSLRYCTIEAYFLDTDGIHKRVSAFREKIRIRIDSVQEQDDSRRKLRILGGLQRLNKLTEHLRACKHRLREHPQEAAFLRMKNSDLIGIIQVVRNAVTNRLTKNVSRELPLLLDITQRFLLSAEGRRVAENALEVFGEDLHDLPTVWAHDINMQASTWLERYKTVLLQKTSS